MTYKDLQRKLSDQPFHPFRIKMVNGTTFDIFEPWMITIRESSAIIVTQACKEDLSQPVALDWRTVSIANMVEFVDINPPKSEAKRKRAS